MASVANFVTSSRLARMRGNIRAVDHLCRTALDLAARSALDTIDAGTITAARKKLP
jgi:hypothetical protein